MRLCLHCRAAVADEDARCPNCGADGSDAEPRPSDPLAGKTIGGKYLVEEVIGAGSMGRVYRAKNLASGSDVALKVLNPEDAADPVLSRRFQQEARAMSRLRHPNNLMVLDFGQTDDGHLYLVTEILRGRTLETIIRDESPLDPRRIVQLLSHALDALAEAHAQGIVHRDFKPENIFVEPRGPGRAGETVKVIDYGIAKLRGEHNDPGLTQAGSVCGTPDYMAPEQIRGEELDGRADVYAAGVVLYEMLTGSRPFTGSMLNVLTLHLHHPPEPPKLRRLDLPIPIALERVCIRALQKAREKRLPSAARMRVELLEALSGMGTATGAVTGALTRAVTANEGQPQGEGTAAGSEEAPSGVEGPRWPLPFVGREAALGTLLAQQRRSVLVIGPPGSGRSRLVDEWRRRVIDRGERVVVMRADPSGARASWQPVRRALAAVLGVPEHPTWADLEAATRDRPADRVGLREVFGLAQSVASDEERPFRRREALAAAAGLLRESGAAIACEDVDRYDRPSVEAVQALMRDAGLGRVVVTSTGQGDLPETETVTLAGLGKAELSQLGIDPATLPLPEVGARGGRATSQTHKNLDLSSGLPGGIGPGEDPTPLAVEQAWRATVDGAADASARGRLDALLPSSRRVLAAAVVAGTEIDAAMLAQATALSDVLAPLSSLASRGLARYEGGRVVLPSPTQRDAFYAALDEEERRALHRTLAGLLAAREEDPALVAHHAWFAAPDAVGLELLERAMTSAERAFDDPGAVRWGIRALKRARAEKPSPHALVETAPRRVHLAIALGEALLRVGNLAHAGPAFKEALAGAGPDRAAAALARRGLARLARDAGDAPQAESELLSAIEAAGEDARLAGELYLELASLRDGQGRGRDAETALIQGAVKAPATPEVTWRLLLGLAERSHTACRSEDARKLGQQSLAAAEGGPPIARARIHSLLASVEQALGDASAATQHRREAIESLRRLGDRRSTAELLLGSALADTADEITPRRWLAEAGELARQVGWVEGVARAQAALRQLG